MPVLALAALLIAPAGMQQTPANVKARQVVATAIAALGGDAYLRSKYMSGNGHIYAFDSSGDLASPGTEFWAYYRYPADERLELTKKRDDVYIYAGGQGWEITYRGVAPALGRALEQYKDFAGHSLDLILKTWAQDPSTLMIYQGIGQYDEAQIESVSFTTQSGEAAVVDFDYNTHLPTRVSWRRNDPDTGGYFQESVVYGNWAKIGGIEAPFSVDRYEGPQRQDQRYYTNISFQPFPDSLFDPNAHAKHR